MCELSPIARIDNASKGPHTYRPGRSTDEILSWMPCKWPTADTDSVEKLLKPLEEKDCFERQYCKRGRKWEMREVKRLLRYAR